MRGSLSEIPVSLQPSFCLYLPCHFRFMVSTPLWRLPPNPFVNFKKNVVGGRNFEQFWVPFQKITKKWLKRFKKRFSSFWLFPERFHVGLFPRKDFRSWGHVSTLNMYPADQKQFSGITVFREQMKTLFYCSVMQNQFKVVILSMLKSKLLA